MNPSQSAGALNIAVTAAREAGTIIIQSMNKLDRIKVSQKAEREWVSEVDIIVEQTIVEQLQQAYPDFAVLGEESGLSDPANPVKWIIDPIDGTHNFLHGHPHCAVSIALQSHNDIFVAVVYDPLRNELFTARKGGGAQLDGRRIRVSENNRLNTALICTGIAYKNNESNKPWLRAYARVLPRVQSIQQSGSTVLDLAYLAAGRFDGLWEHGVKPWDVAAGSLLIQEAGGLIASLDDSLPLLESGKIVAGNPKIYEKLLQLTAIDQIAS